MQKSSNTSYTTESGAVQNTYHLKYTHLARNSIEYAGQDVVKTG